MFLVYKNMNSYTLGVSIFNIANYWFALHKKLTLRVLKCLLR